MNGHTVAGSETGDTVLSLRDRNTTYVIMLLPTKRSKVDVD